MKRNIWITLALMTFLISMLSADWDELGRLTPEEKIYGLSRIWKEADYNYPHFNQLPELNWDREYRNYLVKVLESENIYEYYQTIQKFAALLQDCHTRVIYPQGFAAKLDYPVVQLKRIEGRIIVNNIGRLIVDLLPIGSEILEVDGVPVDRYFKEEIFSYISASNEEVLYNKGLSLLFYGVKGSEVSVKFRYPATYEEYPEKSGTIGEANLVRDRMNDRWSAFVDSKEELLFHKWLDAEVLYVALYSFNDELIIRMFDSILPELKRAKGLVIDLRENRWGRLEVSNEILKYLTENEILSGIITESRKNISLYKAWGTPIQLYNYLPPEEYAPYGRGDVWHREEPMEFHNDPAREKIIVPTVILIGSETASVAEDFVVMLKNERKDITLVGTHSAGSRGQSIILPLPGMGHIFIATQREIYNDGKILTRKGIEPDIVVEQSYQDYLDEVDTVLERGHRVIRDMIYNK